MHYRVVGGNYTAPVGDRRRPRRVRTGATNDGGGADQGSTFSRFHRPRCITGKCLFHRISITAYAVEQQWQSGVPKNEMSLMSFIFKMTLVFYQNVSISISNIYWHASKWSSISFSHWQSPSDREFSFPRFVGLLILSLWF
jgi:hypothetical protein